jgi:hypothetical protein
MNNAILMAAVTSVVLVGSVFILPTVQFAKAQYVGGGQAAGSIEQQLQLAKEKISNAKAAGAYGSGTPMLGTSINSTVLFIIILAVIFGGVAASFFVRARTPKKEATS